MEEYNMHKNHRSERLRRNKSGLESHTWLKRRFARENESCRRMAKSLQEDDYTQSAFFNTFCPESMMKTMVELGENPYRNPKMGRAMHKKKINKFKARARDRKSKLTIQVSILDNDYHYDGEKENTIAAWETHIAMLDKENTARLMAVASDALHKQASRLAAERGTNRMWSSVV